MEGYELAKACAKALAAKKAKDILLVNVGEQTVVCSYFVIASGTSTTQVRALGDNVEEELEKAGVTALRKEGLREGRWGSSTTETLSCISSTRSPACSIISNGSGIREETSSGIRTTIPGRRANL